MANRPHGGFQDRVRLADARERVQEFVDPHQRTERVGLATAAGRVTAETIEANRDVPHYDRAAMDGFAVRAEDTFGAGDRSPAVLQWSESDVGPGEATRVHTGSALPDGADAVVMVEHAEEVGGDVEVFDAVPEGENVAPVGEDVEAGQTLYDPGHRLRPSDVGLLKSVGRTSVMVLERPTGSVIPTGEELVQQEPGPGEVVETNGLTVSQYVERWGGNAVYRDVATDEFEAIRTAIQRDLDADIVVTTGGSSVGERDIVPDVVEELGEVVVHGVAIKPGHPVALGVVEETPVLMLPGYPVSTIVNAVQLLRPALKWAGSMPLEEPPSVAARLDRKIRSEPGKVTFARVRLADREDNRVAIPVRESGAGVLSSVALADGWVVVPENQDGLSEGESVAVQNWEWEP